jgi:hypothetical protein
MAAGTVGNTYIYHSNVSVDDNIISHCHVRLYTSATTFGSTANGGGISLFAGSSGFTRISTLSTMSSTDVTKTSKLHSHSHHRRHHWRIIIIIIIIMNNNNNNINIINININIIIININIIINTIIHAVRARSEWDVGKRADISRDAQSFFSPRSKFGVTEGAFAWRKDEKLLVQREKKVKRTEINAQAHPLHVIGSVGEAQVNGIQTAQKELLWQIAWK